ncbi:MAG TPA: murein biosynthesis integral membrane protein MurJ, partial [Candidatus Lokiarchaeia archaeon]
MKNITISKAISIIFIISIFTKPLTFVKEIATANYFGGSDFLEAFLIAYLLPSLFFNLVGGILSSCFIPIYVNEKSVNTRNGKEFAQATFFLSIIMGVICASLIYILAPLIIKLFAPGFVDNRYYLAVSYLQKLCPYISLIFLMYFLTNLLQAEKEFFYSSITPFFVNLGAMTLMVIFHTKFNILSLIIGHYVGVGAALIFLLIKSRKYLLGLGVKIKLWTKPICEVLKLSFPISIGVSITFFMNIADNFFASMLSYGSVTALHYANMLVTYTNTFIAFSITKATLPFLSEYYSSGRMSKYYESITNHFISLLIVYLPISLTLLLFNNEVISLLFFSKNFNQIIGDKTSIALFYYSLCLIPMGFHALFLPVYYSKKNTKTPMIIATVTAFLKVILSYILVKYYDIAGIAIATLLAVSVQAFTHVYINKIKLFKFFDILKLVVTGSFMILIMKIGAYLKFGEKFHYET